MNSIKYKEAGNGWFFKIFLNNEGIEASRTASFANGKGGGTGLFKEMQEWLKIPGNEIEPQFTDAELQQKEADDLQSALASQKATCIQLLDDSEKAVSNDPPYPSDMGQWKLFRAAIRAILKSDVITDIPDKPF